jgi:serine/threonine protein kinase
MDIRPGTILTAPDGEEITIDALLGQGGFGQVFAGSLEDGSRVAVKTVLTSSLSENELKVLQNEAAHAIGIDHPNVVRVLHFSTGADFSGTPPFLVMELVEGKNLRSIIEAHHSGNSAPLYEELQAMYLQIAAGMQAVNEKVIHRDLKPENILIDQASNQLKIADFGLAKLADAATRSETFKGWGTRPYQAPEAFEFGPNTVAMDVYAAGVTFFELATLSWPVEPKAGDHSPLAWRNAHLLMPPANLRLMRPDLPDSLVQLITLMLQKDPARRPSSWQVVIDRLHKRPDSEGTRPDVSLLVQKATTTLLDETARKTRERAEREARAERQALLEQSFNEPVEVLRTLVDAFNDASDVGKLNLTVHNPFSVEVKGEARKASLHLHAQPIDDLKTGTHGIFRLIGIARINPVPSARNESEVFQDRESFGSFNLGYRLQQESERFGTWTLLRFEHNPLTRSVSYPRWFAVDSDDFRRQLQMLNGVGIYQHQQSELNHDWFRLLLQHLL